MEYIFTESIGMLCSLVSKQIGGKLVERFKKEGFQLDSFEWTVISFLVNLGSQTQSQLVEVTGKNKVAVTRLINRLISKDLVRKTEMRNDKRYNIVGITKEGRNLYAELISYVEDILEQSYKNIDKDELNTCLSVLKKVKINIE